MVRQKSEDLDMRPRGIDYTHAAPAPSTLDVDIDRGAAALIAMPVVQLAERMR